MTCLKIILGILMASSLAWTEDFRQFLDRVCALPDTERPAAIDSFMSGVASWPIIEGDSTVHFVCRTSAASVTVPGDANGWSPSLDSMERIGGTDFWYFTHRYEPDARLDYKFVLDGSRWILDSLNPHQVQGGLGPNSELRMPAYVPPPEIEFYSNIPHGEIQETSIPSRILGNTRAVKIYTPPEYGTSLDSLPVVIFQDGLEYVALAKTQNVIDYLISRRRIAPLIGVFVPPVNRTQEYAGSQMNAFSEFVLEELLPMIESRYRTGRRAASRALVGASNGGNVCLWIAQNHPDVFGNVAALSSNVTNAVLSAFQEKPCLELKMFLDLGTYDIPQLIPLVRNLVATLHDKGYQIMYRERHEGHSWGNWRGRTGEILEFFFPRPVAPGQGRR